MPVDFKDANSELPWAEMAGLRNRIVHDYFGIDLDIIWQVVSADLPELAGQIRALLR